LYNEGGSWIVSNNTQWSLQGFGAGKHIGNGTMTSYDTSFFHIGGTWSNFSPTLVGNTVRMRSADELTAAPGGMLMGVDDPGFEWRSSCASCFEFNFTAANPITITGRFSVTGNNTHEFNNTGAGVAVVTNRSTFYLGAANGGDVIFDNDVAFYNEGTLLITNAADFVGQNTAVVFNNSGTLIKRSGATTAFEDSGTFRNTGTVGVEADTLSFIDLFGLDANTYAGTVLKEGTWSVSNATLNFPGDATNIVTISSAAAVILKGPAAIVNKIGDDLTMIEGTFGAHLQQVFSTSAASWTLPGRLEFGLADPEASPSNVVTGIDMTSGFPDFAGCRIDVADTGLTNGGRFTVMTWTGEDIGTPVIGAVPDNKMAYSLRLNAQNLQIDIRPEPKGWILLVE
jgi:hypothetical protein